MVVTQPKGSQHVTDSHQTQIESDYYYNYIIIIILLLNIEVALFLLPYAYMDALRHCFYGHNLMKKERKKVIAVV